MVSYAPVWLDPIIWLFTTASAILIVRPTKIFPFQSLLISFVFGVWHSAFAIFYLTFVLQNGGDSLSYFRQGLSHDSGFWPGSQAIVWISSTLHSIGISSIWGQSAFFNGIGISAILLIARVLISQLTNRKSTRAIIILIFVFFPSLSFWSSGIGKEPIALLGIALFMLSIDKDDPTQVRFLTFSFSLLVLCLVRPHISFLAALSLLISYMSTIRIEAKKIFHFCIIASIAFLSTKYLANYLRMPQANIESLQSFLSNNFFILDNQGYSSLIYDLIFYPVQYLFTFRTNNFSALSIIFLIENFVLVLSAFYLIRSKSRVLAVSLLSPAVIFFLMLWLSLAFSTEKLGIIARQKWMIVPLMMYILVLERRQNRRRVV